jgi:hypothetical protein
LLRRERSLDRSRPRRSLSRSLSLSPPHPTTVNIQGNLSGRTTARASFQRSNIPDPKSHAGTHSTHRSLSRRRSRSRSRSRSRPLSLSLSRRSDSLGDRSLLL